MKSFVKRIVVAGACGVSLLGATSCGLKEKLNEGVFKTKAKYSLKGVDAGSGELTNIAFLKSLDAKYMLLSTGFDETTLNEVKALAAELKEFASVGYVVNGVTYADNKYYDSIATTNDELNNKTWTAQDIFGETEKVHMIVDEFEINDTVDFTVEAFIKVGSQVVAEKSREIRIIDEKLISSKNVAYDEIPLEWTGANLAGQGYHMVTNTADTFCIETKVPLFVSEKIFKFTAAALGHPNDFKVYVKTAGGEYATVGNVSTLANDGVTHPFCYDFSEYLGKLVSIKIEAIRHEGQAYISAGLQSIGFVQESTKISDVSSWEVGDIYQDWDFSVIGMSFQAEYSDYGLPMLTSTQSISNKIKLGNNQTAIKVNTYGKSQNLVMYVNDVESTLPKTLDKDGVIYNLTAYAGQEITLKFVALHSVTLCSMELITMPCASNYYSQNTEWKGGGAIGQGYHLYSTTESMLAAETNAPVLVSGELFKLGVMGLGTISNHKVYVKTAGGEYTLVRAVGYATDEVALPGANQEYQFAYDFSAYVNTYVSIKIEAIKIEGQSNISTAFNMGFASKDNEASALTSWGYENVYTDWEYSVINMVGGPSGDYVCYPCIIPGQEISNKINVTSEFNAIKVVGVAPQLLTLFVNGVESTAAKVYDSSTCYYNLADYVGQDVVVKFVGQNATIYSMCLDKMPNSWNYDTFASTWTGGYVIGQGYQIYHANNETAEVQTSKTVLVSGNMFKFSALGLGVINSLKVYVKTAEGEFTLVRANGVTTDEVTLPAANLEYQYAYDFSAYVGQNVTIKIVGIKAGASSISTALAGMGFTSDVNKYSWDYGEVFVDWSFDTSLLWGSPISGDLRCYLALNVDQTMTKTVKITREHRLLMLPEEVNVSLTANGNNVGFTTLNGFDVFDLSNYIGNEVELVIKAVTASRIMSINLAQ